jgi:hypothetical protein
VIALLPLLAHWLVSVVHGDVGPSGVWLWIQPPHAYLGAGITGYHPSAIWEYQR